MRRHSDGVTFSSSDSKTLVEELEKSLITTLMEYMTHWKRYADDTIAVIKLASVLKMYCQLSTPFTKISNLHMSWNRNVRLSF